MDHAFLELILISVLLVAVITDVQSCKIPNWLTMSAMATGILAHGLMNGSLGVLFSLKGLAVGMALFVTLYVIGGMGAGDVKLLAAVGSFIGAEAVVSAGVMTMLMGGLYAISVMISHWGLQSSVKRVFGILTACLLLQNPFAALTPPKEQPQLRYGLVIGLGTLMSQWAGIRFFTL
jgi:prepilin peptidase CpaA